MRTFVVGRSVFLRPRFGAANCASGSAFIAFFFGNICEIDIFEIPSYSSPSAHLVVSNPCQAGFPLA
jgi:hypothetical protein